MTIAFVGLDRAGKSSIKVYLESLSLNSAMNTRISNGVETYLVRNFRIDVFPGQEKLRYEETLYERLFPFVSKVVLVVDSVDRKRFPEVRKFWKFVKDIALWTNLLVLLFELLFCISLILCCYV